MAKAAAKTLRVHQLAKELNVDSKAIVAKCEAEGVPGIENHMSVVKLGLAATIREWFSEGNNESAVERAEKVDLDKVRKPRRKAAKKDDAHGDGEADGGSATATLEPPADADAHDDTADASAGEPTPPEPTPADPTLAAAPAPAEAPPAEPPADADAVQGRAKPRKHDEPVAEPVAEAPATDASPAAAQTPPGAARPVRPMPPKRDIRPAGIQNVPDRPTNIRPVGQQLTEPKKVALRGPKLIRVEKPEPDAGPRPRRGPGTGGPGLSSGEVPGIARSRGPARGGGVRGGGPGTGEESSEGGPAGRGGKGGGGGGGKSRRALSTRRGRSADSLVTGPTQLSQADLDELDARLKGATGFVKQRRRDLRKPGATFQHRTAVQTGGAVEIEEPITIKALSSATGIKAADVVKFLFKKGIMSTVNSPIGNELAEEICLEYDIELVIRQQETAEAKVEKLFTDREKIDVRPRPPVVTVLGHVDHGKTSLLDRIRKADVAAHEDGGITQHIGAYRVTVQGSDGQDKTVVFLDTPGHAAFTTMRARGAKMTDIVVLVVAADDGVMPQTVESINHAKAAKVPVVVALNKTDLPGFTDNKLQAIYGQLAEHGLNPTAWGGETEVVKVSAMTGAGITELLEILDLQSEVMELTADYQGLARGTVVEAEQQQGRGSVARVLVQEGQIAVGNFVVIGRAYGNVRDITDDRGRKIVQAGPATPIEISGIDLVPDAGDKMFVTDTLKRAEEVANQYRHTEREQAMAAKTKVTLDNFAAAVKAGQMQELRVVVKADVQGSVETLRAQLEQLGNDEVTVRVLHAAVGGITESDVLLADASDAIVLGFHVTANPAVRDIAEERHVDMRFYRVIYDLTDDVKKALEGMLTPDIKEDQVGMAEVKQVFKVGKVGMVAGCMVTEGSIVKQDGNKMRVVRDGRVITEKRSIDSLRRVKDEAKEVRQGTECGIRIDGFDDLKPGDVLVCYKITEVKRKLA